MCFAGGHRRLLGISLPVEALRFPLSTGVSRGGAVDVDPNLLRNVVELARASDHCPRVTGDGTNVDALAFSSDEGVSHSTNLKATGVTGVIAPVLSVSMRAIDEFLVLAGKCCRELALLLRVSWLAGSSSSYSSL